MRHSCGKCGKLFSERGSRYYCFFFLFFFFFPSFWVISPASHLSGYPNFDPFQFSLKTSKINYWLPELGNGGFFLAENGIINGALPYYSYSLDEGSGLLTETLAENAILALYHFDFKEAQKINSFLEKNHPKTNNTHFSNVYYYWWLMISSPKSARIEKLYTESIKQALPIAQKAIENNPTNQDSFFYLYLYAMQARLNLQNGAYLQAYKTFNQWSAQVEQSLGKEANFEGFYLTSGLYNYLTSQATEKYRLLRLYTLFYLEGDKELGLKQLKKAFSSDYAIWKTEAAYFLMRIYLDTEENALAAQPYAVWLTATYPNNLIFQYYHMHILNALGQKAAANRKANEIKELANENFKINANQRGYFIELIEDNISLAP